MSTTTNFTQLLDTDLSSVNRLFIEEPARTSALPALPDHGGALDDLLLEADGHSVPDFEAFRRLLGRGFRTTAPIVAADILALALAGLLVHTVSMLFFPAAGDFSAPSCLLAMIPIIIAYWLSGLYSEIWVHPAVELRQLTHLTTIGVFAIGIGGYISHAFSLWCAATGMAALVLVPLLRNVCRRACANCDWWGYPTLVVGEGAAADAVASALLRDNNSGLRPVLLSDPQKQCRTSVLPVVNDPATLESIIRTRMIRHAVISLPDISPARLSQTLDRYNGLVPHLLVLSDHSTLPTLWSTSRKGGRLTGIEIRNELMLYTLRAIKRVMDVSLALTALLLGMPLLIAVGAMVKLTSRGPIFFGHSRIGLHGRKFKAWKFRTMRINSEQILREHLATNAAARAEWNQDHKLRDDPRVTSFGRMARRTSLDELPQLWNVLTGDMSLVGPRPIVTAEVFRYGDIFTLYTTVKPGITGMWQVSGRNDIGYDERVLLDQFYIRHWSPWLDIYILAKTVVALLNRKGAY